MCRRAGMSACFCVSVWLLMGPEVHSMKDASNFRRHTPTQKFVRSHRARGHRGAAILVDGQEDVNASVIRSAHISSESFVKKKERKKESEGKDYKRSNIHLKNVLKLSLIDPDFAIFDS